MHPPPIIPILKRLVRAVGSFFKTWTLAALRVPHNQAIFIHDDDRKKRLTVCEACPSYVTDLDMCSICFCKMSVKTRLIESTCPERKW